MDSKKMKCLDLVSVIMPAYNSDNFIDTSISSVLNQTYHNLELIIINDSSTDKTENIIKKYIDNRIVYLKNEKNLGVAKSRNLGINIAKGRFIAFLDSDDVWDFEKLEKQVSFMISREIPFTYCSYKKIDESGNYLTTVHAPASLNKNKLLKTCYIGCLTAIYDTKLIGKVFMPENTLREDYATWLKILNDVKEIKGLQYSLASYRIHKNQNSRTKLKMAKENWKIYRNFENLNKVKSIYYFLNYSIIGIWRHYLKRN